MSGTGHEPVEAKNVIVKRSSELNLSLAFELAPLLRAGETIDAALDAAIVNSVGDTAALVGGPDLSGTQIGVVLNGGEHGDRGKVVVGFSTSLHSRREAVGEFLIRDFDED